MPKMASLHNHDQYSPLDSACTSLEVCQRAKELDLSAVSQTNHGTLAGWRDFQRSAQEVGIKPILGEELYFSETDRYDRRAKVKRQDGTSVYVHLIALAMNDNGLKNLQALDREAWLAYYNKPRVDFELLEAYNEDIIFTSACMGGLLSKAILREDYDYAEEQAKKFRDLLGDRYYIEIQGHNDPQLNDALLELADHLKIKPIIAEDSHYAYPYQRELEEMFLILSTHPKMARDVDLAKAQEMEILDRFNYLYPERKMSFQDIDLYIAGYDHRKAELEKQGISRVDVFENTLEVADRVGNYTYLADIATLPIMDKNPHKVLREKVYAGLQEKGLADKQEYVDRAEYELNVVESKNFDPYFLVIIDGLEYARKEKIRIGKGRGSAAGSLICYATGITGLDPLEHNLIFERFLDPSRPDWPDADIDVQDNRREEIKSYYAKKYKHVASITTLGTYKGKKAIKDAARALGVSFAEVNKATKVLDGIDEITGHDVIQEFADSEVAKSFNEKYPDVVKYAKLLFGKINGYGMHAAGLVIANQPISNYANIETRKVAGKDERIEVIGLDKNECESIGLIKIDFLGLKSLTVIEDALKMIKENHGIEVDIDAVSLDDSAVYQSLSEGKTLGIFQCEAAPYTKLLMRMGCEDFNDLTVSNALVRPGAWNAIGKDYLAAKSGKTQGQFIHDDVTSFMNETYGYPIYQEQMMKLSVELAGFTMEESNKLRKGIGKKKRDIIDKYKPQFIDGASRKISRELAEKLWISFEESGAYAFNKSHAVAYSILSYQTAWLKIYYPQEYMCALLISESDSDAVTDYLIECKRMGIKIKLPHVNYSRTYFEVEGKALRMGLSSVKYISEKLAQRIIAHRPYSSYSEFKDFVLTKGSGLNTRVLSSLNAIGGATFEDNPLRDGYEGNLYEYLGIPAFDASLFSPNMRQYMTSVNEYVDGDAAIIMGVVQKVLRGDGYSKVFILDSTGTTVVLAEQDIEVVKGNIYIFTIGGRYVLRCTPTENISHDDVIMDYLKKPFLSEIAPDQYKILAARGRKTKAGKNMATMVVCDSDKELYSLLVFDSVFDKARMFGKIGSIRTIKIGKLKDGGLMLRDIY